MRRLGLALCLFGASATYGASAHAGTGEISFTPTGLRLSVMKIALATLDVNGNPTHQQVLFSCEDSEENCLVDVTDQSALDAITARAAEVGVDEGTYDTVALDFCAPGKNGETRAPGFVRGVFTVPSETATFVTDDDPTNVTGVKRVADGSTPAPVFTPIGNWSCGQKSVVLPKPLVVKRGATTPLTVVVDAKLIAESTPHVSPGMGGCRGASNGQSRGVCVNYPSMFPIVGSDDVTLDRFLLAHHRTDPTAIVDTKANAYVVVARQNGTPLIAYTRPYFSETSASISQSQTIDAVFGGPGYLGDTIVPSFFANSDGTISFMTGGSLDDKSAVFPAFSLADHHSVVETRGDGTWQYHAMPLP